MTNYAIMRPEIGLGISQRAVKHGDTRNEPYAIRSPALWFTVSGAAAVNSERKSLIQEALTAGAGRGTANKGNIGKYLRLNKLSSNAVHRR